MVFEKKINVEEGKVNLSSTKLQSVLEYCKPAEQYVLVEKYGLVSWKAKPMQQIGKEFDMSRERIRQILNKSLTKVRRLLSQHSELESIIEQARELVKENNFMMKEEDLINKLLDNKVWLDYNELLLILSSDYDLYYIHRNKRFIKFFYIEPVFEELLNDIHDTIYSLIKENKAPISEDKIFYKMKNLFSSKFQRNQSIKDVLDNEDFYKNIILLSRYLYTLDGLVWFATHAEVNPKTMKLKIEYVLSQAGSPLHYEEIAKRVKDTFNLESIKVPTIHNELVKNKEFINVGMWTYGLASWGYNGENTLEAIKAILAKAWRPMKTSEIAKEVLKERLVKEVTILLVLQKHQDIFERVWKWLYQLKKQ
jgi:DNA-directed RNA polymerase delta subunit